MFYYFLIILILHGRFVNRLFTVTGCEKFIITDNFRCLTGSFHLVENLDKLITSKYYTGCNIKKYSDRYYFRKSGIVYQIRVEGSEVFVIKPNGCKYEDLVRIILQTPNVEST
jgi:hypothetical protein